MTTDEIWELKRELVKLGNKGMYQEQIDFMLKNKKFLDTQFCVMFIISFDLTEREKIPSELIKILNKKKFVKNYDFPTLIRLSVINNELEVKE